MWRREGAGASMGQSDNCGDQVTHAGLGKRGMVGIGDGEKYKYLQK